MTARKAHRGSSSSCFREMNLYLAQQSCGVSKRKKETTKRKKDRFIYGCLNLMRRRKHQVDIHNERFLKALGQNCWSNPFLE